MLPLNGTAFPTINGHCSIVNSTIYFTTDDVSNIFEYIFGNKPYRRLVISAILFGVPLFILAALLFNQGDYILSIVFALISLIFVSTPIFNYGYSYPCSIKISDIESVEGIPPTKQGHLATFTIHFLENGWHSKTVIALPYTEFPEQTKAYTYAIEIFENSGISIREDK